MVFRGGLGLFSAEWKAQLPMAERRTSSLRKTLLYTWLGFATPMVLIAGVVMQVAPTRVRRWSARGMARWWARGMLRTTGSKCIVEGLENIEGEGPYVVMSNHRSHMDVPVAIQHLPFLFGFIVKEELMKVPVFKGAMMSIGCVPVSRGKSKDDHSVLDSVAADVRSGKNILIFPEGTRAPSDEFLPFKKGGVITAIKAGVPILPVGLSGTNRVVPARVLTVSAGPVLMKIGRPIPTEGLTMDDRDELLKTVREAIDELYIPDYPENDASRSAAQ